MYIVTYQTKKGLIERENKSLPFLRIGEENSYGWKIVSIDIISDNQRMSLEDYHLLLKKEQKIHWEKIHKREKIEKILERISILFQ